MRQVSLKKKLTYPVETETITYKRKKAKGVRQAIFSQFTPEIVHHELQGEDCTCPDCHGQLKEIGSTVQRQELVFIPAQLKRIDHVQHAYKCQACSQKNLSDKIIKAPVPKAPLVHSWGSASIIAHIYRYQDSQDIAFDDESNPWMLMSDNLAELENLPCRYFR